MIAEVTCAACGRCVGTASGRWSVMDTVEIESTYTECGCGAAQTQLSMKVWSLPEPTEAAP